MAGADKGADRAALVAIVALLGLGGCPGEFPGPLDLGQNESNVFDGGVDVAARDLDVRDGSSSREGAGAGDGAASDGSLGDLGVCAGWSSWSCAVGDVSLCNASCAAASLQLTCTNSGDCICGLSTGPCGQYSGGATPCDICRMAVEDRCCAKSL